jgi:hypothetical protein
MSVYLCVGGPVSGQSYNVPDGTWDIRVAQPSIEGHPLPDVVYMLRKYGLEIDGKRYMPRMFALSYMSDDDVESELQRILLTQWVMVGDIDDGA